MGNEKNELTKKEQLEVVKELELKVEEVEYEDNGKKKKFNSYKVLTNEGRYMDLRFRKEVKDLPTEDCIIKVKVKNLSVDRNRKYPRTWVHAVESIEPLYDPKNNSDDLPF